MSIIAKKLEIVKSSNEGKPNKYRPEVVAPVKIIKATQFVLDGFIASGLAILAASAGAGKTTAEVALAMRITGLIADDFFEVSIKRKVIIFTEHATQIEEIITATLSDGACNSTYEEVRQKIILVNSKRMNQEEIQDCRDL